MVPSAEIDKITKIYTKAYKLTNISTMISKLEASAPQEILLVSKISTDVSLLSGTVTSVTPERPISRKKGIRNHQKYHLKERIQLHTKIVPELSTNKIQYFHQI